MSVQAALSAHEHGDPARATALLLAAWRACRNSRLGDTVVEYGTRVPDDPLSDPAAVVKAIRRTKNAAETARKLVSLHDGHGPDPRLTHVLMGMLRPRLHARSKAFQNTVFELLEEQRDPRMFAMLQAMPSLEEWRVDAIGGRVEIFGAHEHNARVAELFALRFERAWADPKLDRDDALRCGRLLGAVVPDPRDSARRLELWKQVLAAPSDVGARLVYADHLTEVGDPRGAFVVLQVRHASGELDAEGTARMGQLFAVHRKRWFGRVEPVLTLKLEHLRWGWLHHARISGSRAAALQTAGGSRAWNLVREAELSSPSHVAVLLDPAFKSLRTVRGLESLRDAAGLSLLHPRLREVYFAPGAPDPGTEHRSELRDLRVLGLTPAQRGHLAWFVEPLRQPLRVLKLFAGGTPEEASAWLAEARAYAGRTELHFRAGSHRIEVHTRQKAGAWSLAVQLRGGEPLQEAMLDALPEGKVVVVRSTNARIRREAEARFPFAKVGRA